jgi:hypothetical protein
MADFRYVKGHAIMEDYTPAAGNVSAGASVLLGNLTGLSCGIAHKDIENTKLGELALGGGIYECNIASNYAVGTYVYKATGNAILTTTSTNAAPFGFVTKAAAAANTLGRVLHWPFEEA